MITSLEIRSAEPVADGFVFGAVGPYLRLTGTAQGALDPAAPGNRRIALLDQAPRNARGLVEYATGFVLHRPADPAKGNGRLLHEVPNRGAQLMFIAAPASVAPGQGGGETLQDDPTRFFPLHLGFTVLSSGWEPAGSRDTVLALSIPAATENGAPIARRIRDEFCFGTRNQEPGAFRLSYEAATTDPREARLGVRRRPGDVARILSAEAWEFIDAFRIRLRPEIEPPEPGSLYDFRYLAQHPRPLGIGFAATRDLVSFMRFDPRGREMLGRTMSHGLALGSSQSGRYLRHFIWRGFNGDEQGRQLFDGVQIHSAAAGRLFLEEPFAQPSRTRTQHENRDFPESWFPFSTAAATDPFTGAHGALLPGRAAPKMIETNSSSEYWQKGASLTHTDPLGRRDLVLPENTRSYLLAGTQHLIPGTQPNRPPNAAGDFGACVNRHNPHDPTPILRALFIALDEWVATGRPPPDSRVPKLADGTLVAAEALRFPAIPGAGVARSANIVAPPGDWTDPAPPTRLYRPLVSQVDADGNELGGVRTPDIAAPLATYAGWNLYKAPYPEGELGDRTGSYIPFSATRAERETAGDPRPSLAERHSSRAAYVAAVATAATALVRDRLLLAEDVALYVDRARSTPNLP